MVRAPAAPTDRTRCVRIERSRGVERGSDPVGDSVVTEPVYDEFDEADEADEADEFDEFDEADEREATESPGRRAGPIGGAPSKHLTVAPGEAGVPEEGTVRCR